MGALAARRASWVGVLAFSLCWGASAGWMASAAWAEQAGKNLAERGPALTLKGCYERALKQSGEIAIRRELLEETEAHFQQAASALLPRATFSSSDKRQDGSGASLFTLRDVPERRFVLTQPLFAGFKEFSAMAATKAERRQRTQEKARAEQLLLLDVAGAFYLLLEKREEVSALEATRETLVERMDELRRRQEIGRSRPSEVASAEAQRLRVEAEGEVVRGEGKVARQWLEFLTGVDAIGALEEEPLRPMAEGKGAWVAQARHRPDVRAAEEEVTLLKRQVSMAKADFWPAARLEGNYYVERVGASKDVSWDARLEVDVPIFDGGATRAAVRKAVSGKRQADLRLEETTRRAVLEMRDAYAAFHAASASSRALAKAFEAADENYRLQVEEYRRNLVSNLEVLQTLQALQDVRREWIRARYETRRLYWRLAVAMGETV